MREDMAKVIVTRPRVIDSLVRKGRGLPDELLPKAIGLRRHAHERGGYKMLNENLAPLRRCLERQVGRPWDKVYGEIAERLKPTSTVQQHVRDHLTDFVNVRRAPTTRFGSRLDAPWWQPLYVDAAGILRRTDALDRHARRRAKPRKNVAEAPVLVRLSETLELRKVDGLWHEVRLAPLPPAEYWSVRRPKKLSCGQTVEIVVRQLVTPAVMDAVTGQPVACGPELDDAEGRKRFAASNPSRVYPIAKRQLSKRELRRHGLVNDRS